MEKLNIVIKGCKILTPEYKILNGSSIGIKGNRIAVIAPFEEIEKKYEIETILDGYNKLAAADSTTAADSTATADTTSSGQGSSSHSNRTSTNPMYTPPQDSVLLRCSRTVLPALQNPAAH